MNEIVNAYIQQAGLDKTQAQQLMQELQALDETQLQQVLGKMQQQLQGEGSTEAMQYGGLPVDENGIFAVGKNPVVVPTRGTGQISMEGVNFPIDSYDADTMQYLETMQPNQQYQFEGVDNVLEIPQAKFGIQKMQAGGKTNLKKRADGKFVDENGNEYVYNSRNNTFVTGWNYKATPIDSFNVEDFNLTKEEKQKFAPTSIKKQNTSPSTNYFQKPNTQFPNNFNLSYKPVEAIGNPNLKVGDTVDTVGGTPVQEYRTTTKSEDDKFGFVSRLKGEKTSKQDNINDYKTWVKDWSTKIDGFDKLPYANQQMVAMQWVKAQRPDVYDGLKKQWEAKGYNKNGKGFEGFLNDGMYANITSSLRPSLLNDRVAPIAPIERKPTGLNTKIPTTLPLADIQKKVSVPTIEDDSINPADAIIGTLDNRDMSGRYLSNMKLRNNEIKLPYFQQVDLKTPQLYQQDIRPYVNNLYTGYNAAVQNIDMNSAVGQAQALQLNANLDKSINDVSGSVYNQNLKAAIDWENQLTGIYNQQSQLDNQNRAAYSDGVDLVRTNKQNVDNQIDALAYEHKMKQIQNQNKMVLSTLLHPDFYTTDEGNGQMVLKRKYNKAPTANSTPTTTNPSIEAERDFWKDLALKNSKTKVAKYGIGKKKTMC